MLKRLIGGLVLGAVLGGLVAAALAQGLGITLFSNAPFAYLAAAVTGVLTGLVAGKPIWSSDGKIEAGLKAVFGAGLAALGMLALRTWGNIPLDLTLLKAGQGALAQLPAASLPILAAVLAAFYELDNTPSADKAEKAGRLEAGGGKAESKARVASADARDERESDDVEDDHAGSNLSKRKR
jgi:hypothetical protein